MVNKKGLSYFIHTFVSNHNTIQTRSQQKKTYSRASNIKTENN